MDTWVLILLSLLTVGLLMMLAGAQSQARARSNARLAAVERKLDAVLTHLGAAEPQPEHPEVVQRLEQGEYIQAVKAYRDRTGLGLAEAKAAVDRIARDRGVERG